MSSLPQSLLEKVEKRDYSEDEILHVAATQGDHLLEKFATGWPRLPASPEKLLRNRELRSHGRRGAAAGG
jgi:hypothetical protein